LFREGFADKVKAFVQNGGTFVMTYVSGYVNQDDLCFLGGFPGSLREVAGIWAEDVDVLPADRPNSFQYEGVPYICREYFELIHAESAKVLSSFDKDFYAGSPAVTVNAYGKGFCYYIAARTEQPFLTHIYRDVASRSGLTPLLADVPDGIFVTQRVGEDGHTYLFVMNALPTENHFFLEHKRIDLLTNRTIHSEVTLPPRGVMVLAQA
jgi:beta-galactosidase